MSKLTAENVQATLRQCLCKDKEIEDGSVLPLIVNGVVSDFGFHPGRLEEARDSVEEMLSELPDQFKRSMGGGWSFLQACMRSDGEQWGEHRSIEQLLALGIALKLASFQFPRSLWPSLPGGMPYFVIEL